MDYSQSAQPVVPEFFTSGAGTNDETVNNFEAENNLDLTNSNTGWTNNQPTAMSDRDPRGLGGHVVESAAYTPTTYTSENTPSNLPQTGERSSVPTLGEVMDLEMPPEVIEQPRPGISPRSTQATSPIQTAAPTPYPAAPQVAFERSNIKTEDMLGENAIKEVENVMTKFNQDGDAANFYDNIRDMMEVNLENSYGRKLSS